MSDYRNDSEELQHIIYNYAAVSGVDLMLVPGPDQYNFFKNKMITEALVNANYHPKNKPNSSETYENDDVVKIWVGLGNGLLTVLPGKNISKNEFDALSEDLKLEILRCTLRRRVDVLQYYLENNRVYSKDDLLALRTKIPDATDATGINAKIKNIIDLIIINYDRFATDKETLLTLFAIIASLEDLLFSGYDNTRELQIILSHLDFNNVLQTIQSGSFAPEHLSDFIKEKVLFFKDVSKAEVRRQNPIQYSITTGEITPTEYRDEVVKYFENKRKREEKLRNALSAPEVNDLSNFFVQMMLRPVVRLPPPTGLKPKRNREDGFEEHDFDAMAGFNIGSTEVTTPSTDKKLNVKYGNPTKTDALKAFTEEQQKTLAELKILEDYDKTIEGVFAKEFFDQEKTTENYEAGFDNALLVLTKIMESQFVKLSLLRKNMLGSELIHTMNKSKLITLDKYTSNKQKSDLFARLFTIASSALKITCALQINETLSDTVKKYIEKNIGELTRNITLLEEENMRIKNENETPPENVKKLRDVLDILYGMVNDRIELDVQNIRITRPNHPLSELHGYLQLCLGYEHSPFLKYLDTNISKKTYILLLINLFRNEIEFDPTQSTTVTTPETAQFLLDTLNQELTNLVKNVAETKMAVGGRRRTKKHAKKHHARTHKKKHNKKTHKRRANKKRRKTHKKRR